MDVTLSLNISSLMKLSVTLSVTLVKLSVSLCLCL